MSTMPSGGFADYDLENQQLERRRKMAEMLSMQGGALPAGQMVGNVYVPTHWAQHAAQALNGYTADRQLDRIDQRQMDNTRRKSEEMAGEGRKFAELLKGTPGTTSTHTADDQMAYGGSPADSTTTQVQTPGVPGDRNAAMAFAMGAKNPMLQQSAMADMLKQDQPFNLREGEVRYGPGGQVMAKNEKQREHVINGQLVVNGKPTLEVPRQANPTSDLLVPGPNGTLIPNKPLVDVKTQLAQAGRPSMTSTVINAGPKAFETELGKLDAEKLGDWRKKAEAAQNAIGIAQNLRNAEKEGIYSGGGANVKVAVANLIGGMTGADPKKLAASQVFNAEASKLVLEHVKELGSNPSNADRDFIEKTVPMLATSAKARADLVGFLEQRAAKSIDLYNRADAHARKKRGLGGFQITPGQNVPQAGGGGVIDFNALPKGQ